MKWQAEGLEEPACVLDATKDYKQEMDLIAGFVEQCVMIDYDSDDKVMGADLFAIYRAWAKQNNEWEMTAKKFGMEIVKKLPEKGRDGKGVFYRKIALTDYAKNLVPKQYRVEDFK
jgi:putative DNA primase/helicase